MRKEQRFHKQWAFGSLAGRCTGSDAEDEQAAPTLLRCEGAAWATALRQGREEGLFLDVTLVVGGARIRAHRNVLAGFSRYFHALLGSSGLRESRQEEVEMHDFDGPALSAVVDCFYTGEISVSAGTVCNVLRTANLLQVAAIEARAADFFVEQLQPSTALLALGSIATELAVGPAGCALQDRCLGFIARHFPACVADPTFLELADVELVSKILRSDALMVPREEAVLAAVRTWMQHDTQARSASSLQQLLPLVRFGHLMKTVRQDMFSDPLMMQLMTSSESGAVLAARLLRECASFQLGVQERSPRCGYMARRSPARFKDSFADGWRYDGKTDQIFVTPSESKNG